MELFRSELYYIFVRNESSLWWHRLTGAFSVRSAWDLSDIEDIECMGITEGVIGLVELPNVFEPRLMIINETEPVGQLYFHHTITKIKSIVLLNMGPHNQEFELTLCTKHHGTKNEPKRTINRGLFENSAFLNKTVGAVRNVSNTIKNSTQQAATQVKHTVIKKQKVYTSSEQRVDERFEKRLIDELYRVFEDSDSFYYSRTLDLTNSLQRQYAVEELLAAEEGAETPVSDITRWWKHVDDRFFWNKHMLKDIIELGSPACDQFILPIIQGYVDLAQIAVEPADENPLNTESLSAASSCDETFTLGLVSRRSRYQAGTRYNRRGIEPGGKVANYVETEQIVSIICSDTIHRASFVQVRGSVPIFWSQPEVKFRPPPKLDKTVEESQEAFRNHFTEELSIYKHVCIVNLVDQTGREKVIFDAYSDHVLMYNSPDIIYSTFDFHQYCRGMRYENVSILINALEEVISNMRFCWRDERGLICEQSGVFRVNCIDCLDRTNVVETAIAKYVLELQLSRLGLGAPGAGLPRALERDFLTLWADNGDVISRQYSGTKALKGDYTRTGERNLTGMMRDGVASASRYYLSTFKDALRQVAIDAMTGETREIPESLISDDRQLQVYNVMDAHTEQDTAAMAAHVKCLIEDCRKLLVDSEPVLGAWGLVDADPHTGDPHETEIDTVLLLTSTCYLCGSYDEPRDRWGAARVPLAAVASLELGAPATNTTLFNVGRKSTPDAPPCIRINYTVNGEPGYFHMFRSTTLRFFNNMAVRIHTREEMIECLHSICESILVARDVAKLPPIPFMQGVAMEKKKSKVHPTGGHSVGGRASLYLGLSRLPAITRHVSEAQLVADIRNVGSKALTNMSEQFSKLNRLGARAKPSLQLKFDQGTSRTKKIFTLGSNRHPQPQQKKKGSLSDGLSSDYSSDDENRTNIFEPTLDNFENNQVYIGKAQKTEPDNDCDLIENPLYSSKIEPSEPAQDYDTGLVMKFDSTSSKTPMTSVKRNPFDESTSPRPEITIDSVSSKPAPPSSLVLSQKLSHSSSDLDNQGMSTDGAGYHMRSNSQHEITLNIATSHSESALKQLKTMTSPMSSATRDMVLSPLSKIAKGVQNLGANLDPRKIKTSPTVKYISEQQYEEHRKLQEKWRDCKTRLVAL
ncbi:phosphatidylinositide phosphatase SAC2 [Plutella xylostella]|uniref:phosphatidylinositide phosphatase SAC2 n=1 Tax=Plutella xylostella TaxID=51655 RepID=UPI002032B9D4|nr:phosphatidylinositide phosphatase SAC2 [Plutella xylostella]